MNRELEEYAFAVFLLFCRVGGCVMFAPGLSSVRVPMQVRLLISVAVALALSPLAVEMISEAASKVPEATRPLLIFRETAAGTLIGLMSRFFILALQFAANVIWNVVGLGGIPGIPMDEMEAGSPLATLVSIAATAAILGLGLHVEILRAVLDSYRVIGVGLSMDAGAILSNAVQVLRETSLLALRLSAPFIAYGVVANAAIGLINRFAPQISVYHATTGLVMLGGLFLFYLVARDWIGTFVDGYQAWLMRGGF